MGAPAWSPPGMGSSLPCQAAAAPPRGDERWVLKPGPHPGLEGCGAVDLSGFSLGEPRANRGLASGGSALSGAAPATLPASELHVGVRPPRSRRASRCSRTYFTAAKRQVPRLPSTEAERPMRLTDSSVFQLYQRMAAKSDFTRNSVSEVIVPGHSSQIPT